MRIRRIRLKTVDKKNNDINAYKYKYIERSVIWYFDMNVRV